MVVVFALLAWLFAGALGLAVALAIIVSWSIFDPPRAITWGLAVGLLAIAPVVLMIEGLPASDVVGAQFGLHHLAAHRVVVIALLLVVFAALTHLLGLDQTERHGVKES
jgi:hypothetical protein